MKVRKHSKRRFASAMSKRQGRNPWTQAERDAMSALLKGFTNARFLKSKPVQLSLNATTVIWRPRSYVGGAL